MKALILILLPLTFSSCNGQVESKPKNQEKTPLVADSTEANKSKDPLFFIDGQLCQHLRKIFQDTKGHLWFGTNVYGVMRYNGDTLEYFTERQGYSGGRATGILEDDEGHIWIASGFGLNKFDGESFTVFTEEDGLGNNEIWCITMDSKGIFWIGHNEGLTRFDGEHFENIPVPKPQVDAPNTIYSPNRITGIAEDEKGNLWLGTDGYGICRYDGKNFTHFTVEEGLCDNTIYGLMADSKGNLWIGTFWGGVSKFDGEQFTNYTKDGVISGVEVSAFFEDKNGDIWFGVENNGVYRYDGSAFIHYYKEEGLDGSILSIYRDQENRFWFGGWGGLFRFREGSFTPVTSDGPWR
jgi:ligand-binding sensor domain-containing protein